VDQVEAEKFAGGIEKFWPHPFNNNFVNA